MELTRERMPSERLFRFCLGADFRKFRESYQQSGWKGCSQTYQLCRSERLCRDNKTWNEAGKQPEKAVSGQAARAKNHKQVARRKGLPGTVVDMPQKGQKQNTERTNLTPT